MVFDERNVFDARNVSSECSARRRAIGLVVTLATVATSLAPLTTAHAETAPVAPESAPIASGPAAIADAPPAAGASATAEQRADAQRLREQGEAHFDAGRYAQAAAAFARAYELTHTARDRFNQGTALHWAGECTAAREAFEAYLALQDEEPLERAERHSDAKTALDYLERQCPRGPSTAASAGPVTGGTGNAVPANGAAPPPESSVLGTSVASPAGTASTASATPDSPAAGSPLGAQPGLLPGATPADPLGAASGAPATNPEPDHATALPGVLRWSALGTGAALAVAAIATGFAGQAATTDLEHLNRDAAAHDASWDECCVERAHQLNGERRTYQTATAVLGIASGVLLGTAAVLWTLDLGTESPSAPTAITSATLTYRNHF